MGTIAAAMIRGWFATGMFVALTLVSAAHATPITISGTIRYSAPTDTVSLHVDRVDNDSQTDSSGTLRLELWAFATPYSGGDAFGFRLAACTIGTLPAFTYVENVDCSAAHIAPPNGTWIFTVFVTEYTAGPENDGFDPRDWVNFPNPVVVDGAVAPATAIAVEYFWAARDHYFVTAAPGEIAALDASAPGGWVRTGWKFGAYAGPTAGANPVCRFYLPPVYGDSHYYSASPQECADVRAVYPGFTYEAPNVIHIVLPDTTTGACPTGSVPVYRLWNNRADTNHRYTTSVAVRDQMLALGYVAEGYGPDIVSMCAPQ